MLKLPKSKTFWTFASITGGLGGALAWDRYKLTKIRKELRNEAHELGSHPASETIRKVTIVAFGKDRNELRKMRTLWRAFTVDLFTIAGCDYQMVEFDADRIDRVIDKALPVPEGQAPPSEDHRHVQVVSPQNWLRPMMKYWIYRLTRPLEPFKLDLESLHIEPQSTAMVFEATWRQQVVEPRNKAFLEDGIVALNKEAYQSLLSGCQDVGMTEHQLGITTRLAYIPCDVSSRWWMSIWRFFNRSALAREIGNTAMAIIKEQYKTLTPGQCVQIIV